jgi:hypothetical protein
VTSNGALARCVGDVGAFTSGHWGTAPLRRSSGGAGSFDDLLSLADVDHIVSTTAPRRPAIRLVRDGEPIPPASYTRTAQVGGERVEGLIEPGRVFDLYGQGATIVLQSLQRSWAPLTRFCRELELELGHPVQANAYLTPPGAAGLAPHHDGHDVLVLQVAGSKRWVVSEPLVEAPLPHQRADRARAAASPVLFEAEVLPGDVLYLPRGFIHAARSQQAASLHLTIGVLARTVADVVHDLVRRAVDADPGLRRSLAPGAVDDPATLEGVVAAAAAALAAWAGDVDPAPVAADLARRFTAGRRPLLEGQLQQLAGLDAIGDTTCVRRRPRSSWRLEGAGETLDLVLGDRTVTLPAPLRPALERLAAGAPLAVGDLGDLLDGPSRLVLVRRLVREGALVAAEEAAARAG